MDTRLWNSTFPLCTRSHLLILLFGPIEIGVEPSKAPVHQLSFYRKRHPHLARFTGMENGAGSLRQTTRRFSRQFEASDLANSRCILVD